MEDPSDFVRELYSKRLDFKEGDPRVSVRLVEGITAITFSAETEIHLRLYKPDDRQMTLAAKVPWHVRLSHGVPARFTHWIELAEIQTSDKFGLELETERWRDRGLSVITRLLGSRYGIHGKVIDNRRTMLLLNEQLTEAEIPQRQAALLKQFGTRSTRFDELVTPPKGSFEILDSQLKPVARADDLGIAETAPNGMFILEDASRNNRTPRRFRGALEFTLDRSGDLAVINLVSLEDLLKGLVPSEIPGRAPSEALKAQAVTARGEILAKIGTKHLGDPYLICSEEHCAVYRGFSQEAPATTAAVKETRGQALFSSDGKLVNSVYSAVCGGHTEDNDAVWGGHPDPSLRGKPDFLPGREGPSPENLERFLAEELPAACRLTRFQQPGRYRWQKRFSPEEMNGLVASLGIGELLGTSVTERGVSGRAKAIVLTGDKGETQIRGELNIRRLFGNLYSSMFIVTAERDEAGKLSGWIFRGGGWGHGVGMCQTGAIGRAEAGQNYREILRYYFSGADVATLY